jgi:hypothetical protein
VNRIWTRVSVRAFAVFVLVMGLIAGAYLGIPHLRNHATTTDIAQGYVDRPDPIADQQLEREAMDGYRQRRLREEASRSASRDAELKAWQANQDAAALAQDADKAQQSADKAKASSPPAGPVSSSCKAYTGNRATGCTLMLQSGFKIDQMTCLDNLWEKESGWNPHASNPSGAYGIPQALPGDKMAQYGDAATQIKWGLAYIKSHYSTPCGAWQHSQDTGWY